MSAAARAGRAAALSGRCSHAFDLASWTSCATGCRTTAPSSPCRGQAYLDIFVVAVLVPLVARAVVDPGHLAGSILNMANRIKHETESAARLLALVVASNGRVDPRELAMLDELDAFERLGVTRARVIGLAQDSRREQGAHPGPRLWLSLGEQWQLDRLLDAVAEPAQRLLLCRLAAAVVTADGCVTSDERALYTHMLARWGISDAMVTQAILAYRRA
jgi:tellurite resistance protein